MTDLQDRAKQHLMLHFSDMTTAAEDIPVIVRGEGSHVFDDDGNRYIDGLSGLLLPEPRPLPRGGARRGGRGADEPARLLQQLDRGASGGNRPGDEARRARARRLRARLLHLGRVGVGRVRLQDGRPVAPGQRRAAAQEGHRPPRRLPRGHARSALVHWDPGLPHAVRAAADPDHARLLHQRLPSSRGRRRGGLHEGAARRDRGDHRLRDPRDDCDDDHGAGPERRRLDRPARRVLGGPA